MSAERHNEVQMEVEKDNSHSVSRSDIDHLTPTKEEDHESNIESLAGGVVPPPAVRDGGLVAWLHVVGGFLLVFNTWGMLSTFGVFQTYYESGALFDRPSSDISWIGTIQAALVVLVGFVTGPIYDRGYLRLLIQVGSFAIVFGLMILSICKTFWQVLLAQGFCIGIGQGCLFVPCVAVLPTYFPSRAGLVIGLSMLGSAAGGIIYPIVLYRLLDPLGFDWSVRVLGFIALGTLLAPIVIMRQPVKPTKVRALIDMSACTDIPYLTFVFGTTLALLGYFAFIFYISYFGAQKGITNSEMSFYIVPIMNAASCFGRIIPNALSDKFGPLNLITPCCLIFGVLVLCMLAVTTQGGLIVIAVLAGFFSGALMALPPFCFVALTEDKSQVGTRMGMGFGICACGILAGPPAAGEILALSDTVNWAGLWLYSGIACCAGGLIYVGLRLMQHGFRLRVWA